jgi:hypothetical protein
MNFNKMNFNKIKNYYNKNKVIEPFDGIRKEHSRIIFNILLTIIIIDCIFV